MNTQAILDAPPDSAELVDELSWPEFRNNIRRLAESLGCDYLQARTSVITFYRSQSTFHLAALAEMARSRPDCAIGRYVRDGETQ